MVFASGYCGQCTKECNGNVYPDFNVYCESCIHVYNRNQYRCVTYAVVYNMLTGEVLSTGDSAGDSGNACAERDALWSLPPNTDTIPKRVTVIRHRRNGDEKSTFGNSDPCIQCTYAMAFYNVHEIAFSLKSKPNAFKFKRIKLKDYQCELDLQFKKNRKFYKTKCKCIVRLSH